MKVFILWRAIGIPFAFSSAGSNPDVGHFRWAFSFGPVHFVMTTEDKG